MNLAGPGGLFLCAAALLTVLSALAVLEHWLLYLPLPARCARTSSSKPRRTLGPR